LLTGKRFKLERSTIAIGYTDGKRKAVSIPVGAVIIVVSGPRNGDGTVNVHWDGRLVEMFEVDVNVRGTEITEDSAAGA
jgi:hypothetical protein